MLCNLLTGNVATCIVSRFVILRNFSISFHCEGLIMRRAASWLPLRPWFLLIILHSHFVWNFIVFSFLSPTCSVVFLLCCRFSRLPLSGARPAEHVCMLEVFTALYESAASRSLLPGLQALVTDVRLLSSHKVPGMILGRPIWLTITAV